MELSLFGGHYFDNFSASSLGVCLFTLSTLSSFSHWVISIFLGGSRPLTRRKEHKGLLSSESYTAFRRTV